MMHPPGPRIRPGEVVQAVAHELESAGVQVLDVRACSQVGLLLISGELVVWCWGRGDSLAGWQFWRERPSGCGERR
jgi:hypothetical protein